MCIEAAICTVLDLPHGDDPKCVTQSVRSFKISLNDKKWSSGKARAEGLRDLGLAQLGSLGVVDSVEFSKRLAYKIISVLLPTFVRDAFPKNVKYLEAAKLCEDTGSAESAMALRDAAAAADADADADAAYAAAAYAAYAAAAYDAAAYADAAAAADAYTKPRTDKYLLLAAKLALDTLRELSSPGIALLG
jgi:hypothetical protein